MNCRCRRHLQRGLACNTQPLAAAPSATQVNLTNLSTAPRVAQSPFHFVLSVSTLSGRLGPPHPLVPQPPAPKPKPNQQCRNRAPSTA